MPYEIGNADPLPEEIIAEQEIIEGFEPLVIGDKVEVRFDGKLLIRHVLAIRAYSNRYQEGLPQPHARMVFRDDSEYIPVYFLHSPGLWFRRKHLKKVGKFRAVTRYE